MLLMLVTTTVDISQFDRRRRAIYTIEIYVWQISIVLQERTTKRYCIDTVFRENSREMS